MLKDITFGQYFDSDSCIHHLNPITKILSLILLIVFIFLTGNLYALAACAIFVLAVILLSGIPLKMYLKNIKVILPIIVFTALINLFYGAKGDMSQSVYRAVYLSVRIILLILISSVLTYTTTPNDLTDAIEKMFSPLGFLGLRSAVHTLAMMMTIALRFIPTLVEETEKIMNAQKARGADLESGKLMQRIRALIPILIPLLVSSVRRAYELAEAMECRCYNGGKGRQRMKQMKFGLRDAAAGAVCFGFCAVVILLNFLF